MALHTKTKIPRCPRLMFLGKKYGSDETVFSIEAGAFDAKIFCHIADIILDRKIDYVIIEPSTIEQVPIPFDSVVELKFTDKPFDEI